MGTNDKERFPNERPAHFVRVQGFWMEEHDVTNAEFSQFIEATGYVTTAEPDPFDHEARAAFILTRCGNKNHETDKPHPNLTPCPNYPPSSRRSS
jgi:formylglycine-generating enzyme required for sulfatase activity